MKKTVTRILIIIILTVLCPQLTVAAKEFPDVPTRHPNYEAVSELTGLGVISGYEDGTFQPEREITRTEFCALMARILGCVKETYNVRNVPFSDVKRDYWGIAFISFCYERNLINGMGDGRFAPAEKVTMAQAVKMAVCAIGKESEAKRTSGPQWYSGYMKVAEKYGLLEGTDQLPDENAIRANVAQIVYNMANTGLVDIIEPPPPEDETDASENNNSETQRPEDNEDDEVFETLTPVNPDDYQYGEPHNIPGIVFTDAELEEIDAVFASKNYADVKVIVIDPGHNYSGKDIGARIDELDVREEIITWQIADRLCRKLKAKGYTVYMTRPNINDSIANVSVTASLQARVDYAHKMKADLFISVHCNMGGGTGSETYCYKTGGYGARLASLIQKNIKRSTGLYNRGVKTANFYVTKNTAMPSVLVETGFLDNEKDRELLLSEEGQNAIADVICNAVVEYDKMDPIVIKASEPETAEEDSENKEPGAKETENSNSDNGDSDSEEMRFKKQI